MVHAEPGDQNVHWLHGGLHLHEELDLGTEPVTFKRRWTQRTTLVDGLREDLARNLYPLFVMEGESLQKRVKINASPYLRLCLSRLRELDGALFTFGCALSPNDEHIMDAIARSGVTRLFVGVWGDPASPANAAMIGQAYRLRTQSRDRIRIHEWDASTAPVW